MSKHLAEPSSTGRALRFFSIAVAGGAASAVGWLLVNHIWHRRGDQARHTQLIGLGDGLGQAYQVLGQIQTDVGGVSNRVGNLEWRVGALERRSYASAYQDTPYRSIYQPPTASSPPPVVRNPSPVPEAPAPDWTVPEEVDAAVLRFQLIEYD